MSLVSGLLNQTVSVYSVTTDGYGDNVRTLVYSSLPCRLQNKIEVVLSKEGTEKPSKAQLWYEPEYTINDNYQIYTGSEYYMIISKEAKIDLSGTTDHYKLYLA